MNEILKNKLIEKRKAIYLRLMKRGADRSAIIHNTVEAKAEIGFYVERHRIVPGCMGGKYEDGNISWLTPEEHFLAHVLLVAIHRDNNKLIYAVRRMDGGLENSRRKKRLLYGWLKRVFSKTQSTRIITEETRKKMSEGVKKRPTVTEETRKKMSERRTGKRMSKESREKLSNARKGIVFSDATKSKLKIAAKNRKPCSEETRAKLKIIKANLKWTPEQIRKRSETRKENNRKRKHEEEIRKIEQADITKKF